MKKIIILIVVAVVVYLGYFVARGFLDAMLNGNSPRQIERRLQEVAAAMSQKTPQKVDDLTTLEKVTSGPGLRLDYSYQLDLVTNRLDLPALGAKLKAATIQNYKTTSIGAKLRDWKVEVRHQYRDKNGDLVADFTIYPNDL